MQYERPTRRKPRLWLSALIALLIMSGTIAAGAGPASANTGGYPDIDAVSCGSSAWCKNGSIYSARGYAYRNCTDFVAWKLQSLGVPDSKTRGLGNGGEWAANAMGRAGVTVNNVPAYGAAAVMPSTSNNPYGHVAFVEAVNSNGTITISEYNYGWGGTYNQRTATAASMGFTQFVHFGVSGSGSGFVESFQANNGNLYYYDSSGSHTTSQGMASGTSPDIARIPGGGVIQAFQANTGNLHYYDSAGGHALTLGVASGTSPSVAAASSTQFRIAFRANTGNLYQYDSVNGATNLSQGMAVGTSPSITRLAGGGYVIAFQANTGNLHYYDSAGGHALTLGMKAGTSPSIAASSSGGFRIAFQANNGNLYQYDSVTGSATNLNQGMMTGTSPGIAATSSGYVIAFQANNGNLYYYDSSGSHTTSQGMAVGTSPSIAGSSGGWKIAFQANNSNLYVFDTTSGAVGLQQGMKPGTSPAITG